VFRRGRLDPVEGFEDGADGLFEVERAEVHTGDELGADQAIDHACSELGTVLLDGGIIGLAVSYRLADPIIPS
jgi:hypothetical protein